MTSSKFTHSGNILLAGFGGMLVMMSVLIYLTVKQDIPMVSKNYYEQELVYQQQLDAANNSGLYEKEFRVSHQGNVVTLWLPPALSREMDSGGVYFYCPSVEDYDRHKKLDARADGIYTFRKTDLPGAAYVVKISLHAGGKDYYRELNLQP